jgi:protein-L-isoaspartate(D-aspartate) O-methyltransferase
MNNFDIERARFNMIEQQIRTWEVLNDRVLDIIKNIPREEFVPERYKNLAFSDLQLPLPHEQAMEEPRVQARILQAVDPQPSEQVLEIGSGSGYLTACLAKMAAHVTSVDIFPELTEMARRNLAAHGTDNVTLQTGDAARGWDDGRRYDVIVVTGSLPELHKNFHRSLTIGGRLFLMIGKAPIMEAELVTRIDEDQWATEGLFEGYLKPLVNAPETRRFVV